MIEDAKWMMRVPVNIICGILLIVITMLGIVSGLIGSWAWVHFFVGFAILIFAILFYHNFIYDSIDERGGG